MNSDLYNISWEIMFYEKSLGDLHIFNKIVNNRKTLLLIGVFVSPYFQNQQLK